VNKNLLFSKDSNASNVRNAMEPEIQPVKIQKLRPTGPLAQENPQSVLIAIPTFQRSRRLKMLLSHVIETLETVHRIEILIVDNNALPIEQKFVQKFSKTSPYPVHYIHEAKAGVSNARNAALGFATSRFVGFLDDDMEITKSWIDSLVQVAIRHEAGIVFGPLTAKFMDDADPRNSYLSSFYTRHSKQTEPGLSDEAYGTGGCLIDLDSCPLPEPPFDTNLNESGGEDDIFFEALRENGVRIGWAPEALCYECVPPERTTSKYIARRNFGYGQGPSRIAASRGIAGTFQLIRHMSVGLAQLGIFGTIFLVSKLGNRPSEVRYLALTARGLGKILWFDKFQQKFYGIASLDKKT